MKLLDLALIGGAAYLILSQKGSAAADSGGFSGGGSFTPPPGSFTPEKTAIGSSGFVPGTEIPMSKGFSAAVDFARVITGSATDTALVNIATKQDLGTIKVTSAPLNTSSSPAVKAANETFKAAQASGSYVPSSYVAGKGLTAWDMRIAANLAAKNK
jgi:hypothetical protein